MYKSVIWDWNGTLLDDFHSTYKATTIVAEFQKLNITKELYKQQFKIPIRQLYLDLGFNFEIESFEELTEKFMSVYTKMPKVLSSKAYDYLKKLHENGTKNFICSAAPTAEIQAIAKEHLIHDFLHGIYGANDPYGNSKVITAKKMLEIENFQPESSIVIGDSYHDYEVARELGCQVILLAQGSESREKLIETGCTVLDDFTELEKILFTES